MQRHLLPHGCPDATDTDAADTDDKCSDGKCECQTNAECDEKEDGDLCNGVLYCELQTNTCVVVPASVVSCTSTGDDPCLEDVCDPKVGKCELGPVVSPKACDDGNPCTPNDGCVAGVCVGETSVCECDNDSDCAPKDDGNACNGTLFCDKSGPLRLCKINAATAVTCYSGDDSTCLKNLCDPATGLCQPTAVSDGSKCEWDGNKCTQEGCADGVCAPGEVTSTCDCTQDTDCGAFEDGDACNGTLYCDAVTGTCRLNPATVVSCAQSANTACSVNACDKTTGACSATLATDGTKCDDGAPCTDDEKCKAGACEEVTLSCACSATADCQAVDDTNACNGVLYCDKLVGKCRTNPASVVVCPLLADGPCSQPLCNPSNGKCEGKPLGEFKICEADGSLCTGVDYCVSGKCNLGAAACACSVDADCAKADTNLCAGVHYCDKAKGACQLNAATKVFCTGGADCAPNTCEPASGDCKAQNAPDQTLCDVDDFGCTADVCVAGACAAGPNKCHCAGDSDCAAFEDGKLCNGTLTCSTDSNAYLCEIDKASIPACSVALAGACTATACSEKSGKCEVLAANEADACDDLELCTVADQCSDGACVGTPAAATAVCDDADKCTTVDRCAGGKCVGKTAPDCDDQLPCTVDSCDTGKGCLHGAIDAACSDGIACTADLCDATNGCLNPPNDALCKDSVDCTEDTCDLKLGCLSTAIDSKCDDAEPCNGSETCAPGTPAQSGLAAHCKAGKTLSCDDGNTCTTDSCAAGTGCKNAANTGQTCNDGTTCTAADKCDAAGACVGGAERTWAKTGAGAYTAAATSKSGRVYAFGNEKAGTVTALKFTSVLPEGGGVVDGIGASGGDGTSWFAATQFADGAVAVGRRAETGKGYRAVLGVVSGAASKLSASWEGGAAVDNELHGVLTVNTEILAVGCTGDAVKSSMKQWWLRLNSAAEVQSEKITQPTGSACLAGLIPFQNGYAATGWTSDSLYGGNDALFVELNVNGAIMASHRYGGTLDDVGQTIARLDDGTAVVGGYSATAGGSEAGWIYKIDEFGKQTWQKVFSGSTPSRVNSVSVLGTLVFAAGYWTDGKSKKTEGLFTIVDDAGETVLQRAVQLAAGEGASAINGFVLLPKGIAAVGLSKTATVSTATIRRLSDYADSTCAAAGKCWDTKDGCDDGDPCTRDSCHAALGCQNTKRADGATCTDGTACTRVDTCIAGKCTGIPRVWTETQLVNRFPNGSTAWADDSFIVVGNATGNGTTKGWWAVYPGPDPSEQFTHGSHSTTFSWVAKVNDEAIAIAGRRRVNGTGAQRMLVVMTGATNDASANEVVIDPTVSWSDVYGLAANSDRIVAVGAMDTAKSTNNSAVLIEVPVANFSKANAAVRKFGGTGYNAFGAAILKGTSTLLAGAYHDTGKFVVPWLLLVNKAGKKLWETKHTKMGMLFSMAAKGNDIVVGGHFDVDPTKQQHLILRANVPGGFLGAADIPVIAGLAASRVNGVAMASDGHVFAVGQHGKSMNTSNLRIDTYLHLYDGALANQRSVKLTPQSGQNHHFTGISALGDGRFVATGNYGVGGNRKGFIVVGDRFLNPSCDASLDCITRRRAVCSDGKPCTRDFCGAGKCTQVATGDGKLCDDGNKCSNSSCALGACKAGPKVQCDDGDKCTADSCDPAVGCKHMVTTCE